MNLDEIETTPISELSEKEFDHVAIGISANSDLELIRTENPEMQFMLTDRDGFEWIVSKRLTAREVFRLSQVITEGESHPYGSFFKERPFYEIDRKRAAAGDN